MNSVNIGYSGQEPDNGSQKKLGISSGSINYNKDLTPIRVLLVEYLCSIKTLVNSVNAFLPLVLAAEHSQDISLGTSIAVAFPRPPAILAHIAWDLAQYSKGRFIMGLGSQTNNHFQC